LGSNFSWIGIVLISGGVFLIMASLALMVMDNALGPPHGDYLLLGGAGLVSLAVGLALVIYKAIRRRRARQFEPSLELSGPP